MSNDKDIKNQDSVEDAISQMNEENLESASNDMTSEEALSLMTAENTASEDNPEQFDVIDKKEEYRILTIIEKTELLMGDFFKKLASVDSHFNNVAQGFVNNAVKIGESKKELTKEEQNLVMIYLAAAGAVKGIGALWQSIQTELQMRGVIQVFAQEAEEKMPYIGMLIDWLDTADDIAFERLMVSPDLDIIEKNLEFYKGLNFTFRLANFLYSVYDASLKGEFTKVPYPTMYDVNLALINNLAHIESKETESGQLEANRAALSTVAKRIRSVMTGETELPNLIDVMIASDSQLMATAINMGLPAPDSFEDEDDELGETHHFPFEELTMVPESIDYVSEFSSLKGCGDSHEIAQKINNNATIDNVRTYIEEFSKNQKSYNSRLNLYGINSWLLAGVTFLLFWKVWDWAWYWSLLMGIVLYILNAKCSPISNITRISRNKAILLERDLIKFSKSEGGYTEVIDFRQLRRKNNNVFFGALIGGIIGLFLGPFGVIAGIIIGSLIGLFLKGNVTEEDDWRDISIGTGWGAKVWCCILSVCLLYLILSACIGWDPFSNWNRSDTYTQVANSGQLDQTSSTVSATEEAVEVKEGLSPETEAVRDLYSIFYGTNNKNAGYTAYSKTMLDKFKEMGISSNLREPFTPSFQAEIDRMNKMQYEVGDLSFGFDSDILFLGQDGPVEVDMHIKDVRIIDEDNCIIKVDYKNSDYEVERVFKMKKINGSYRIDDMDNNRDFIENECKEAEKYLQELRNNSEAVRDMVADTVYVN